MAETGEVRSGAPDRGGALLHRPRASRSRARSCRSAATLGDETLPGRGKGRIFRVFELLERLDADGPTDLREAFTAVRVARPAAGPRGRDLRLPRSAGLRAGPQDSRRRSATTSSSCTSRRTRDRDPGALGEVRFVDAETGEHARRRRDARARRRPTARRGRRTPSELEHFCGRYNLGYVRADAEAPFEDIILQTFRKGRFLA